MDRVRQKVYAGMRHFALTALAILLVLAGLGARQIWSGRLRAAPALDLTASRILAGRVIVEPEVPGLFAQLRETLGKSPEGFQSNEASFIENMVFLTAAEFSLVRSVDPQGQVRFPLRVGPAEFRLAVMKYDTLEGGNCVTAARIVRQKRPLLQDIFLFSGDAQKYGRIDPGFNIKAATAAAEFEPAYKRFADDLRNSARSPLTVPVRQGSYPRFEAVLQWAKLQYVTLRPEQEIINDAPKVLRAFGFS